MANQLLLLELNEVNFEFIEFYARQGRLPNFARLIRQHGLSQTTSETEHENLEPWIQWVTAHTGLSFAEHGVFRLGDIVKQEIPQIWELLEDQGLVVGAISPMNAKYRMRKPAFFVPDPWTRTEIVGGAALKSLYAGLAQVVSDNATAKVTPRSAAGLLRGFLAYAQPRNYAHFVWMAMTALASRPWRKAVFLDLLLSDVFLAEVGRTKPHFASLFLNAAAHIQHHYMFCAQAYDGKHRNPSWYVKDGMDPVFEVYEAYDRIIASVQRVAPTARIMLATGLHQIPHPALTFYWRLKNHEEFLRSIRVPFVSVTPLMSRDFIVVCASEEQATSSAVRLAAARAEDGLPLFAVDNRGRDLFVMLTYPNDIDNAFRFHIEDQAYGGLEQYVAFVALKNGEHNGIGYFLDTNQSRDDRVEQFPLSQLPMRIASALDAPAAAERRFPKTLARQEPARQSASKR